MSRFGGYPSQVLFDKSKGSIGSDRDPMAAMAHEAERNPK
jgi:hypothetical protein